jgi:microcystin degradation protein MlrC
VAAAEGVGTGKGDNLTVVEAHAVEDVTEVLGALRGVRETAVGGLVDLEAVNTAGAPGDGGATSLLDGGDTTKSVLSNLIVILLWLSIPTSNP